MHSTRIYWSGSHGFRGGGCASRGCFPRVGCFRGGVPAYTGQTPPVNRMTDRCKNITFPHLRLRTVKSLKFLQRKCPIETLEDYMHQGNSAKVFAFFVMT